jgi:hypothetical protein
MARAVVARDEDEDDEPESVQNWASGDTRVAELVEATAARFHRILDELIELRQLVKGLTAQNEVLTVALAALRAKIRDEDLSNGEDLSNEDLEGPAEDLPQMLN